MRSKFFAINLRDFLRGLVYALIAAVVAFLNEWIIAGNPLDVTMLKPMGLVALATLLAYISGNLFQNSKGEFFQLEK
jgi:hypothetical protein